jgi:hypothetical protein
MAAEKPGCLFALLQVIGVRRRRSSSLPLPQQSWKQLLRDDAPPAPQAGTPLSTTPDPASAAPALPTPLPYALQRALLTRSERAFYYALKKATNDEWIICPQVRLADVFFTTIKDGPWFGKISSKHVDFLLCEPETFRPVLGIELDDPSHHRLKSMERDEFVNGVFAVAKLPLIRVPTQLNYEVNALKSRIDQALAGIPRRTPVPAPQQDPLTPLCPKCGAVMVQRIAQWGERRGKTFYGCSNYPQCKQTFTFD